MPSTIDRSYRRLRAWHSCHAFTLAVYSTTRRWPREERFGLTSQLRRSAVSAEANIAEGAAKRGAAEFARFLSIANGSLSEAECLLEIARDLSYFPNEDWLHVDSVRSTASRQAAMLLDAVRARAKKRPVT
jgi:four helix bundle protein